MAIVGFFICRRCPAVVVAAHNEAAAERIARWCSGRTGIPIVAELALLK